MGVAGQNWKTDCPYGWDFCSSSRPSCDGCTAARDTRAAAKSNNKRGNRRRRRR